MTAEPLALLTILGMAIVTYATRVGGIWLMSRTQISGRVAAWLHQVPGAILVAILAPTVIYGGTPTIIAAAATVLTMIYSRSLPLAMAVGVVIVWLLR